MQSHGETIRKYGHSRRPSYGKAMSVSALLMNYSSPSYYTNDSIARDGVSPENDQPPMLFTLSEVNSHFQETDPKVESKNFVESEQVDCSVSAENEFVFVSMKDALPSNDDIETCPMTELCNLLCDSSCKKIENPSTDNGCVDKMNMKARANDNRHRFLTSMISVEDNVTPVVQCEAKNEDGILSDAKMATDYIDKLKVNEALVRTSMLTSPAARRRLAARKIEMELDAASENAEDNEYVPPRELLMFLVRMGSFNSAPKINNADTQDDFIDIPAGLTSTDLVHHCIRMRGDNRPPLLKRNFLKPIDVTDGVRMLQLNAVSKNCSAPESSPNHVRILQWNVLSQSLGQNNDGFVRCPDEALNWECRKFLMIQEIVQTDPDIVCLQEVDHFKFLQSVLSTQQYEGIFYPKPDSPCLYISENNGPDGCAIFFKKNKFELVNYDTRILEVWRVQSNQVAIAVNLKVLETGKVFSVCTTHLKARKGALLSKLRNEQGKDLLRFAQNVADTNPLIMCGDFNAEPSEPVYKTILQHKSLGLSSAYADLIAAEGVCLPRPVESESHDDETDAVDNHEPPFTTWKIREDGEVCHTIDYVFYTPDKLKVNNCLMFPQDNEIGCDRTPSYRYPSDHFSLVCDFEFTENGDDDATETSH